jgi:dCTP deaminase
MILTGEEIKKQVGLDRIHIVPFMEEHVNPNSYNYRLAPDLLEITDDLIDPKSKQQVQKIFLREEGYLLQPGRLYLGSTVEEIGSDHYVTSLIGRSSVGRLGIFLQITADLGHLGAKHRWTLELKVVQPVVVYPLMKIGQVSFWCVEGGTDRLYEGKYAKYSAAQRSEIYLELNES